MDCGGCGRAASCSGNACVCDAFTCGDGNCCYAHEVCDCPSCCDARCGEMQCGTVQKCGRDVSCDCPTDGDYNCFLNICRDRSVF